MEYTIIIGSRNYDLPKKTLAVMEQVDEILKVDAVKGYSIRQKFEKLHAFMKDIVGADAAKEMFGSDDISEIDLSELTLAVKKVVDAYDRPITEYDSEKARAKLSELPVEKIISIAKAAEKMSSVPQQK